MLIDTTRRYHFASTSPDQLSSVLSLWSDLFGPPRIEALEWHLSPLDEYGTWAAEITSGMTTYGTCGLVWQSGGAGEEVARRFPLDAKDDELVASTRRVSWRSIRLAFGADDAYLIECVLIGASWYIVATTLSPGDAPSGSDDEGCFKPGVPPPILVAKLQGIHLIRACEPTSIADGNGPPDPYTVPSAGDGSQPSIEPRPHMFDELPACILEAIYDATKKRRVPGDSIDEQNDAIHEILTLFPFDARDMIVPADYPAPQAVSLY